MAGASVRGALVTGGGTGLQLVSITKAYPGVRALADVSLDLAGGRVHGIVGENGAGKSTLVNVIAGGVHPDAGSIRLNGVPVSFSGPWDARARGIAVVHQEFQSLLALSVAENVLLGSSTLRRCIVDWRGVRRQAEAALESIGASIDVRLRMEQLGPAQRKLVEIARAVHGAAQVLVLDEPTAALEADDSERLYAAIARLRDRGVALAFVSHRLDEVLALSDEVTVLRDGRVVGSWPAGSITVPQLIEHMVGRQVESYFASPPGLTGEPLLAVRGFTVGTAVRDVTLGVARGEILGLGGLLGSGRTELVQALFGAIRRDAGTLELDGQVIDVGSPAAAVAAGICYVPANRQQDGLVFTLDVGANLSLGVLPGLRRRGFLAARAEEQLGDRMVARLRIVTRGLSDEVEALSGGNQQKILLARWLAAEPKVLVLDEPTQGIDVGAKAEIHRLIADLAATGIGIVLITSDLQELTALSDRIIVMRRGRVIGELARDEVTEQRVVALAAGVEVREDVA